METLHGRKSHTRIGMAGPVSYTPALEFRWIESMDIDVALRELGPVEAGPLIDKVMGLDDDAWEEQQYRQNAYEVHKQTRSLVMVFCSGWPEIQVTKEPAFEELQDVAVPVMHDIIARFYPSGGTIIRAMAAKLLAGGIISPHRDTHQSFAASHRIHVPITTNPGVRFMLDGRPYRFEVGNILFGPRIARTRVATEAIYLSARYALEELSYRRFEWKCDSLNAPSRRAAERFGFRFEGVFRRDFIVKGRSRDTAWYAMTEEDWPRIRAGFERWLAPDNFDGEGRQRRSLSELRSAE